jgi:hypothetical protein
MTLLDVTGDDIRSSSDLTRVVGEFEDEHGIRVGLIAIDEDQERWLKFELFQHGKVVTHIAGWHGRFVIVAARCDDCGHVHG